MKVIFLDVDFVLNRLGCPVKIKGYYFVLDEKIELLRQLVARTGARIVLSSTWREGWHELDQGKKNTQNIRLFMSLRDKLQEFEIELMDKTIMRTDANRGLEIDEWLKSWDGEPIESYVILDDMNGRYLRPHAGRLVHTSADKGLTQRHVEIAVKLLEKPLNGNEF